MLDAFAIAMLSCFVATPSAAQLLEPAHFVLERVIHGPTWPTDRRIGSVEAHAKGGRIHFPVRQSAQCREIYEFDWWFDEPLQQLAPGEQFKVNANGVLRSTNCANDADPYFTIDGNLDTDSERLRTVGVALHRIYQGIEGHSGGIYLKGSQQRRGPREVWLRTPSEIPRETPYVWFGVMIRAPSPFSGELVSYEVIYLYRARFQSD